MEQLMLLNCTEPEGENVMCCAQILKSQNRHSLGCSSILVLHQSITEAQLW